MTMPKCKECGKTVVFESHDGKHPEYDLCEVCQAPLCPACGVRSGEDHVICKECKEAA